MTATETPPEALDSADGNHETGAPGGANPESGDRLFRLVASNDHKDVGRMWIGFSLLFFVGLVALGLALSIERLDVEAQIFGSVTRTFQGWILFRTAAIFLVVIPMFIGIATVITPLQVGSAAIAFPRMAAAAFWTWLFASVIHIISFVADGGLGPAQTTSVPSTLLTMVSLGFIIVALLGASIAIATTIVALRPTGMGLIEVPAFSWSMLVATSIWLLSLPVLVASLIFAYVDLQGRPFVALGDPDLLWARVEWAWSQPQVFAYAIPVLGILADIIPVKTQSRQAGRPVLLGMIGAFGALSFGAWAQSFYSKGADPLFVDGNLIYDELLYILFGIVIFLPAFGAFSGAMDQIRRGKLPRKPEGSFYASIFGALLLLGAVVIGEVRVLSGLLDLIGFNPSFSALESDGVLLASSGAILAMVVAAAMTSAAAALVFWAPKIFGGYAIETLALLAGLAALAGGILVGVADLISALDGQPDDPRAIMSIEGLTATTNLIAVIGAGLLAAAALGIILSVIPASRSKELLPDDPWDGHTLEWATSSPPPIGNFAEPVGRVRSAEPLLDELEEAR